MLIYIGTPMMAVGLWNCEDVDRIEASLYRKIMRIGNDIPNKVILNTMNSSRPAADVVFYLSREAQNEYRPQSRVTTFFDKIKDREVINQGTGDVTKHVAMDGSNE